jgi:hypothetical protein
VSVQVSYDELERVSQFLEELVADAHKAAAEQTDLSDAVWLVREAESYKVAASKLRNVVLVESGSALE